MSDDDIYLEFEKIKHGLWQSKRHRLFQQMIQEQIHVLQEYQQPICAINGDQTILVNYHAIASELTELKEKLAQLEVSTLDEETKRELKQLKNQIATLRAEGFTVTRGATYIPGLPTVPFGDKPDISVYAQGYGGDHARVQNELKDTLKQWFKDKREDLELPEIEEPQEVDSGFAITIRDPSKCHEPVYDKKTKEWRQCGYYRFGESKYCKKHQKPYEVKHKDGI